MDYTTTTGTTTRWDNAETRPVTPPPAMTVYRRAGRDSRIVLPVVPAKADKKPD